jgi:hypothetical protein
MNLNITNNQFQNITEIWIVGSNSVEILIKNHNQYRIIAQENIRSGATPAYYAAYEKLEEIKINSTKKDTWVRITSLPSAYGDTIDSCILQAISWLNQQK